MKSEVLLLLTKLVLYKLREAEAESGDCEGLENVNGRNFLYDDTLEVDPCGPQIFKKCFSDSCSIETKDPIGASFQLIVQDYDSITKQVKIAMLIHVNLEYFIEARPYENSTGGVGSQRLGYFDDLVFPHCNSFACCNASEKGITDVARRCVQAEDAPTKTAFNKKFYTMTYSWHPPQGFKGEIVFVTAISQSSKDNFVNLVSNPIFVDFPLPPPPPDFPVLYLTTTSATPTTVEPTTSEASTSEFEFPVMTEESFTSTSTSSTTPESISLLEHYETTTTQSPSTSTMKTVPNRTTSPKPKIIESTTKRKPTTTKKSTTTKKPDTTKKPTTTKRTTTTKKSTTKSTSTTVRTTTQKQLKQVKINKTTTKAPQKVKPKKKVPKVKPTTSTTTPKPRHKTGLNFLPLPKISESSKSKRIMPNHKVTMSREVDDGTDEALKHLVKSEKPEAISSLNEDYYRSNFEEYPNSNSIPQQQPSGPYAFAYANAIYSPS